ncbi:MAG: hypothetical protein AB8H47_27015, partial [Bacteroidia bacterium]
KEKATKDVSAITQQGRKFSWDIEPVEMPQKYKRSAKQGRSTLILREPQDTFESLRIPGKVQAFCEAGRKRL